jgi:hypothetical protein
MSGEDIIELDDANLEKITCSAPRVFQVIAKMML